MPKDNTINGSLRMLEAEIEKVVLSKKVPSLPDNVKEIIVKLSPWFAVLGVIVVAPLLLAALGLSAVAYPFAYMGGARLGFSYGLGLIFSVGILIIDVMAIPGLFKRSQSAWRLMFYSGLLSLLQNLLSFNLGSLILGGAISMYFLFQVKSKYTK